MQLHNIAYYPVKSMRGIHTDAAAITAQGITHDREWLLSTPGNPPIFNGRFQ